MERRELPDNLLRMEFLIKGGPDKMSLHITPLNGYKFKQWSLTNVANFENKTTHFVFLTYGYEAPLETNFWILLEGVCYLILKKIIGF